MIEVNTFELEWFRSNSDCLSLTVVYYLELRKQAKAHDSKATLCRCRDCGIRFLTPVQNRKRTDMRCPTGCRQRHEKKNSNERSTDYYESEEGKKKKKALNRRRSLNPADGTQHQNSTTTNDTEYLSKLLRYFQWIILLIDGIRMNGPQLTEFCEQILTKVRQRGRGNNNNMHYNRDD